jgi:aryl-alcohol dehydrogenase-like predicted oxidoreductase
VQERTRAIVSDLDIPDDRLAETALRFVLREPTVSTVIPGMRSVRNVERNVAVADGRGLPPEHRNALRAHRWVRNFYR